ncbi:MULTISPECIES: ESPR-type extended signal peptide-containing protein, partial [unclassified Acinetobacter]|uniref:ESPR-type extended signal peptide-containing protein n=1 Tax=unclassified Acinetobacter TaxID=196816 RepID=UPI0024087A76
MNKIYRLVWNKSLNLWMVVSEIARGSCKKRNITVSFPQKTNVEKNQNIESVSFKVATLPQAFQILGITVLLSLSFVISSSAYAATYTGSQTCSAGAGVGPDSINRPTDTNPVNGSGTWSNVVGCNAKGNNHLGVQVVGAYASATGAGATVMGFGSEATTRATAYGMQAQASGTQSTAVGSWAQASGVGSVAMGTDGLSNSRNSGARASGNQAVAIAGRAIAAGDQSIAIGHNSNANGDGDIALGRDASAKGVTEKGTIYTATALGASAQAEGKNTTAVGQKSKATKLGASALGGLAEATAEYSSALGNGAKATANFATATGNQANASAVGATVAGSNSVASGELSSGFGALVQATGNKSTAVGTSARSKGASSVAVGDNSQAQGDNDIALGRNAATASGGSNNIAVGNGVTTGSTGQNVAMGSGTTTANAGTADGGAVAIGRDQKAAGDGAVAIGDPNNANGNGAVAVGRNNTAAGNDAASTAADGAVALGNENKAIGQGSVALGNRSTAAAAGAIALGDAANAQASRGIALGSNAVATNAEDVALGAGSQTSTATGAAYRTGTAAPASVVSVGTAGNERRIQNLSDGAADTDAVNVRQLKNVQDGVDQLGESTADALGGGSSYDPATGAVTAPNYNVNGNTVNNVGDAITALDKGWTLQSNGENAGAVKAGDTVDIGTADGEENLKVAKEGNDIKYSLNRDLKVDSVTAGDTVINNDGMTITGGPSVTKSGIDAAGNKVTNVADGTEASDAVNKGQLDKAGQDLTDKGFGLTAQDGITVQKKLGEAVDVVGADENITTKVQDGKVAIELAKDLNVNSVKAGDTVINNDGLTIANGPSVTKSGIDAAGNKVTNVADGTEASDAVNKGQLDKAGQDLTDKGFGLTAQDGSTVQKKLGEAVDVVGADENITTKVQDGKVAIELAKDLNVNSVKAGDTTINNDGMTITGGPSMTKSGIDAAGNKVSNVADGTEASDAVNKGQLDKAGQDLTDKGFGLTAQDGSTVQKKLGEAVDVVGADENITTKVQDGKVAIELTKDLKVDSVTAGDTVINNDGMSIVGGPSVTKTGIDAAGNKISNVAAGTEGTDAVNKDQLDNAAAASKTEVTEGKNITVTKTTGDDGQDIYNVATADDVEFNNVKVGDVSIDGTTGKISGVTDGTIAAGSKEAVNGGQL